MPLAAGERLRAFSLPDCEPCHTVHAALDVLQAKHGWTVDRVVLSHEDARPGPDGKPFIVPRIELWINDALISRRLGRMHSGIPEESDAIENWVTRWLAHARQFDSRDPTVS